jgi:8-oxo-dGTP pyrophosphatase MutT (NUDIX family)
LNLNNLPALLAAITALTPIDERERESIDEVIALAPTLENPFSETTNETHLTASAIVVGTRGTVLHRHKKLGIWVQPGGHIDDGESGAAAALREANEETGLVLAHPVAGPLMFHVDVHPGPRGHRHFDLRYLILAGDQDPAPGQDESQEIGWFSFIDAHVRAEDSMNGVLQKAEGLWDLHESIWREKVESMNQDRTG